LAGRGSLRSGLKVAVIGGGSTYTPELIEGFIKRREQLNVSQIRLMDVDSERLMIVGGLAQRMVAKAGVETEIVLTTQRHQALEAADFVVTQLRVGGLDGRARDETIPLEFGIVGQETTGPGGFAMALRTIPVMLEIAREAMTLCPDGWLINFTNPSGLIAEALARCCDIQVIGLCNAPITLRNRIATLLSVEGDHIRLDYFGLNHLSWIRGVYLDGQDVTGQVLAKIIDGEAASLPGYAFSRRLLKALGMIPTGYLQYYYHADEVLEKMRAAKKPRAEIVRGIDQELLGSYQDINLAQKPAVLEQRGGAWYSDAAVALIDAIANDKGETHIVNVPNQGALKELPDEAVVEIPALVNRSGAQPLVVKEVPPAVRGLMQAVKAYEQLTVEAATSGSRETALLALVAHPLVRTVGTAEKLLDRILVANRAYLPQFE
jgi:6-phospho-beta-glucosidase